MAAGYRVPAIVSAMSVLRELRRIGDGTASQAELVRATGVSKSSMHNLLGTLEAEGMVARDGGGRGYRLGPALITLGAAASGQTRLIEIAGERLAPLVADRELSFAIAQPVGVGEAVIVERFYPPRGVHVGVRLGSTYGCFDGAIGKCILAGMPTEQAASLVAERTIPAHTARTLTEPDALLEEVESVRERGWAASKGELNENNAVAAVVLGRGGRPALLLLALGFADQLGEDQIELVGSKLASLAEEIRAAAGLDDAGSMDRQILAADVV